jgi:hypothetical protein
VRALPGLLAELGFRIVRKQPDGRAADRERRAEAMSAHE